MSWEKPKFLTQALANSAASAVLSLVFQGEYSAIKVDGSDGHLVILAPEMDVGDEPDVDKIYPNLAIRPFTLLEVSVGDVAKWKYPFRDIARCKALQLWHQRNDGGSDILPHLLFPGDTAYWGGVFRKGLAVGFSGVDSWHDRMIAGMVADICIAGAYDAWMKSTDRKSGLNFIL